ncbi:MAG TPA: HAD-IA family hydrolase, partial [Burkholderiales bacterium]|nr:HAD-IA family hydrolase [Burkholderiales bacterium]
LLTGQWEGEPEAALFETALSAFERHYRETFLLHPQPYPGVIDGLRCMHECGLRLACVTNKAHAFTAPLLAHTGLMQFFDLTMSGDSLPAKKPDPLPLLQVARQFDLAPERLLVIGDSPNDAEAGRAAGCPVVCVPYGYRAGRGVHELDCDAIVCDLVEACRLVIPV